MSSGFLGDHFSAVVRGRKLCVLIFVYFGSSFVVLCHFFLVFGRQLLFLVFFRRRDLVFMRVLMPLLSSLTWMRIYRRKALLAHRPMIIIVSGCNFARYSSMANPDWMEWVPTTLCENSNISLPNKSVPALSDLVVI